MKRYLVISIVGLAFATGVLVGNPPTSPSGLRGIMGEADFRSAGLHKLTPDELARLETWLEGLLLGAMAAAAGPREPGPEAPRRDTSQLIQSRIDGTFEGWTGDTVFVLQNGQVWRQVEFHYHYHYAYSPRVTLVRSGGVWRMSVEGVAKSIRVEQLR